MQCVSTSRGFRRLPDSGWSDAGPPCPETEHACVLFGNRNGRQAQAFPLKWRYENERKDAA
jgi:hypothetical protein